MKGSVKKLMDRNTYLNECNEGILKQKKEYKNCKITNRISDLALKENIEQIKFNNDLLQLLIQEL